MGPLEPIVGGLTVLIIFLGLSSPIIIIGLVYYLKKRLEHKQILAAIEKGTPLSELRPSKPAGPVWIRSVTGGIMLILIAAAFGCLPLFGRDFGGSFANYFIAMVLFAVGVSRLIAGFLQRKVQQRESQGQSKDNAGAN